MDEKVVKPKRENRNKKGGLSLFFENIGAEFRKIVWPTKAELFKSTIIVIIISLFMGALIFGMDVALNYVKTFITDLT